MPATVALPRTTAAESGKSSLTKRFLQVGDVNQPYMALCVFFQSLEQRLKKSVAGALESYLRAQKTKEHGFACAVAAAAFHRDGTGKPVLTSLLYRSHAIASIFQARKRQLASQVCPCRTRLCRFCMPQKKAGTLVLCAWQAEAPLSVEEASRHLRPPGLLSLPEELLVTY